MTLKIQKLAGEHGTTLKLIGRIRAEPLAEVKRQIAASAPSTLELKEVMLVDAEVVRFLSACESEGVHLEDCSAYLREWIVKERERGIKGSIIRRQRSLSNYRQPDFRVLISDPS